MEAQLTPTADRPYLSSSNGPPLDLLAAQGGALKGKVASRPRGREATLDVSWPAQGAGRIWIMGPSWKPATATETPPSSHVISVVSR